MKLTKKLSHGIIVIIIAIMHTQFALSSDGFIKQFIGFSKSNFYNVFPEVEKNLIEPDQKFFEDFSAFWFFYFGMLLIPLGILMHTVERKYGTLPFYFVLSYLVVIILGVYMVPVSGMTYFMLPHAVFLLVWNYFKDKKMKASQID